MLPQNSQLSYRNNSERFFINHIYNRSILVIQVIIKGPRAVAERCGKLVARMPQVYVAL